jgi:hypothetical protein
MNKTAITMSLSGPECKLILRLRQLRKSNETALFMVTTSPLTLSVMGQIELLESGTSGSGTSW